uniref:BTB domain-containing protein n=1 Tax=Globodera pallida TaxID=36090 RepID=A0A183BPQ2_GLOPA
MKRSRTQSSSSTGGDQQIKDNKYKRSGQIVFQMPNFKEFSEGHGPKEVLSAPVVYINGLPWRIEINHCDDYIIFKLHCCGDKNDMAWTCRAASQFSIVSCKKSAESLRQQGNLDSFDIYHAKTTCYYEDEFVTFEDLMDVKNGLYDEKADTVTFKAVVVADKPNGMPGARTEEALLVNGKLVNSLALHSDFFSTLFFGENAEEMSKVEIDEVPDAVTKFERLLSTIYPHDVELDDNKYKRSGQIVFQMPNFKEFSEGHGPKEVLSAPQSSVATAV